MITIIVREGEHIDKALRLLKKKTAGMLKELRERRYFKKPSQIKREKRKEAERKRKNKRRNINGS